MSSFDQPGPSKLFGPSASVELAINQMERVPSVEFMYSGKRSSDYSLPSRTSRSVTYCLDQEFPRPKYTFQQSCIDNRIVSQPIDVKRSHSVHALGSSSTMHQILTNRYNPSGPIRGSAHNSTIRRSTVHRLSEAEDLYVPKESWLTTLYTKLPKSKTFCRFQLELLKMPLFASVGRFLEETATTDDCKAMLDRNSFLYSLFKQFVPDNRIPLNTLSKYVNRLHKHEILATIEFNVSH